MKSIFHNSFLASSGSTSSWSSSGSIEQCHGSITVRIFGGLEVCMFMMAIMAHGRNIDVGLRVRPWPRGIHGGVEWGQ